MTTTTTTTTKRSSNAKRSAIARKHRRFTCDDVHKGDVYDVAVRAGWASGHDVHRLRVTKIGPVHGIDNEGNELRNVWVRRIVNGEEQRMPRGRRLRYTNVELAKMVAASRTMFDLCAL